MKRDKIYLVGFMGAGKTTLARELGSRLGWRVEDVDQLIEARAGLAVTDIFAQHGEPYFREIERAVVELLLPLRRTVVATGGGTFVDPGSRSAMNVDGLSVWLDLPFDQVLARVPRDGSRPLAASVDRLAELYEQRRACYGEAHLRLDAAGTPVEQLADAIVARLQTGGVDTCDISS